MLLVIFMHRDLMISSERVHEGHHLVAHRVVDQMVDVRLWEEILRACIVQVSEIDA